jgi:type III secretion system FlhB-like substrate exporter
MAEEQDKLLRVVGVSYELGDFAPTVVLKSAGVGAEAVLDAARRSGDAPPVVRDPTLVQQLYRIPVDGEVGRELFPVMATLLAHVVQLDRHMEEKLSGANMSDAK